MARTKSCRYTAWRLCREHGPKGYGLWTRIAGWSKEHCGNGNWRRKNLAGRAASTKVGQFALNVGGGIAKGTGDTFKFLGSGLSLANTAVGPIAGKLGGAFMGLLGTFGPVITGIGGIIAVVSLLEITLRTSARSSGTCSAKKDWQCLMDLRVKSTILQATSAIR